jgi:hypothetical protein
MVLQRCRNSLEFVADSYIETSAASSNDANEGISIKVEEGTDMGIQEEEIHVVKFE